MSSDGEYSPVPVPPAVVSWSENNVIRLSEAQEHESDSWRVEETTQLRRRYTANGSAEKSGDMNSKPLENSPRKPDHSGASSRDTESTERPTNFKIGIPWKTLAILLIGITIGTFVGWKLHFVYVTEPLKQHLKIEQEGECRIKLEQVKTEQQEECRNKLERAKGELKADCEYKVERAKFEEKITHMQKLQEVMDGYQRHTISMVEMHGGKDTLLAVCDQKLKMEENTNKETKIKLEECEKEKRTLSNKYEQCDRQGIAGKLWSSVAGKPGIAHKRGDD